MGRDTTVPSPSSQVDTVTTNDIDDSGGGYTGQPGTPSTSADINGNNKDGSNSGTSGNYYVINGYNYTNSTNNTDNNTSEITKSSIILPDSMIFLHLLWVLIPIILVGLVIYRKKYTNKRTKVGCFNFTTNKTLQRCKSMPNLYAAIPTAVPPRNAVSDSEIELEIDTLIF